MNLYWFSIYLSVLSTGSLSEAARQNHVSQPSVSAIIKSLEQETGKPLLIRASGQRKRIEPTREGYIFGDFCRKTLSAYAKMHNDMYSNEIGSPFSLIVSPSTNSFFGSILFRAFRDQFPLVRCSYRTGKTKEELDKLKSGECQLAIFAAPVQDESIAVERFLYDPLTLVCPADMKLGYTIQVRTLKKLPLVIRNRSLSSMKTLESGLRAIGTDLDEMNISLEVQGFIDVLQSVSLGMGCGFVPKSLLYNKNPYKNVSAVNVERLQLQRFLSIARLKNAPLNSGAQLFWDFAFSSEWRQDIFTYDSLQYIDASRILKRRGQD